MAIAAIPFNRRLIYIHVSKEIVSNEVQVHPCMERVLEIRTFTAGSQLLSKDAWG